MYKTQRVVIRPARRPDLAGLAAMVGALSVRSRSMRFLSGGPVIPIEQLAGMLETDGDRSSRGAWVASLTPLPAPGRALRAGRGSLVGHANWAMGPPGPVHQPRLVEVGVVVADGYQGRGLGGRLLAAVVSDAWIAGAEAVRFDLHADNRRLLGRLQRGLPVLDAWQDGSMISLVTPISAVLPVDVLGAISLAGQVPVAQPVGP